MSRRKSAVKRTILPDARYDSQTVSKFINVLMYQGKKSTAERIFYAAMDLVENRTSQPGVNIFKQALTGSASATGSGSADTSRPRPWCSTGRTSHSRCR